MTDAASPPTEPVTLIELFGGNEGAPVPDPYPVYARLRREDPAKLVTGTGYDAYLLTRHADVLAALVDDRTFSSRANADGIGLVIGRTIVQMNGLQHHRYRALVTPAMAPRNLQDEFRALADGIAHDLIDRFAGEGHVDLVEAFTFSYPLMVFNQILGLPVDDYEQMHRWAIDLTHVGVDPMRGLKASHKLKTYFEPVIQERREEPRGDIISTLVQAEVEGERLTDDDVSSFLRLLITAGAETTYHLLGSTLFGLLHRPEQLDEVLADRAQVRAALDEGLRWESPVQILWRATDAPVTVAGVDIPEDSRVVLALGSANRDETVFDDPATYDLHRDTSAHIAFGQGAHFCAGSRLAYAEATIGMNALLDRLPNLRLDPEQAESGIVGLAFRGPASLHVRYDAEASSPATRRAAT